MGYGQEILRVYGPGLFLIVLSTVPYFYNLYLLIQYIDFIPPVSLAVCAIFLSGAIVILTLGISRISGRI